MKLCSACSRILPKESFSKRQWELKQHQRKCKECIDANHQVVQLKAPPKIDSSSVTKHQCVADDEGASCWICLQASPDDDGQPLRRDCSCRGTYAGFVHLSCVVKYAEQKSQQCYDCDDNKFDLDEFMEPWKDCPICKQPYQNELALDSATNFVTFVEGKYQDNLQLHLRALTVKLFALYNLLPTQRESAKQVASNMLSMIGQMRAEMPSLAQDIGIRQIEATAYGILGCIAEEEGTQESATEAVGYYEKHRDISKSVGWTDGVFAAEINIAHAMSKCEGGADMSVDEQLKCCRELYILCVKEFGQVNTDSIDAGMQLAIALKNAHHGIESERLLTNLASSSKRVHGPGHQLTQKVESKLQKWKVRKVGIKFDDEVRCFQALRYEDDGKKCIVQGPIATPRNIQNETEFTFASTDLLFQIGTPVVCHGLDHTPHLNGKIGGMRKDGETTGYKVHFEDKELEPFTVELDNIRILFELPDEL